MNDNYINSFNRRKFRSQTSDNMDRWKSRGGKSQTREERREEKRREEERRLEKRREEERRLEKIREEKGSEERRCRCGTK